MNEDSKPPKLAGGATMQTVDNALRLLEQFRDSNRWLGVSELARALDLNKATVHLLVRTLVAHGYLEQHPESRKYGLGLGVVELAGVKLAQLDLNEVAAPYLTELMRRTGETVHMSVLYGTDVLYVAKIESLHTIRVASRLGSHGPVHSTATGKVLLAFQEEEEFVERVLSGNLERFTPHTVTDPQRLRDELRVTRERGYSLDDEGTVLYLRSIAAPVRDASGQVVAAVAIGGPSVRLTNAEIERDVPLLLDTTARISEGLGYRKERTIPHSLSLP